MEFKRYSQAHPQTQAELAEAHSGTRGDGSTQAGKKSQKGKK